MQQTLLIANVILLTLVLGLGIGVAVLARQIRALYQRVAPAGALMISAGPAVGEPAPALTVATIDGESIDVGAKSDTGRSSLIFFLSTTCPICDTLLPVLRSLAAAESKWLDIVLASDGERSEHLAFRQRKQLEQFPYVLSTHLGMTYQVAKIPFAVLIDSEGMVRAKGLTNNREHLESLFEAHERGIASLQEYLFGADASASAENDKIVLDAVLVPPTKSRES